MSYWFIYYIVDNLSCGQVLQLVPDTLTITEHQNGKYLNKDKIPPTMANLSSSTCNYCLTDSNLSFVDYILLLDFEILYVSFLVKANKRNETLIIIHILQYLVSYCIFNTSNYRSIMSLYKFDIGVMYLFKVTHVVILY